MGVSACANPTDSVDEQKQHGSAAIVESVKKNDDLAAMLPDYIKASGRFTVSINPDVEPIKLVDAAGEIQGLNPDLLRAAAKMLGVEVEFQRATFDSMVPGLEAKRYDVIASMNDYVERQAKIDFIDYMKNGDGILASTSLDKDVTSPEGLCGLKVAYVRGASHAGDVKAAATACEKAGMPLEASPYQDPPAAILAVRSGQADAYWGDIPQLVYNVQKNPGVFKIGYQQQHDVFGIGIHKDNVQLRDALRAALLNLAKDGVYDELLKQWGQEAYGLPDFPMNADISCEC